MPKINNIEDLTTVVIGRYTELENISPVYLSEAGQAAREAYRAVLWYLGFYDNLKELSEDGQFNDLVSIPGKPPEYYKILRMINRTIERAIEEERV